MVQLQFWKAPSDGDAHDLRGCTSYVQSHILPALAAAAADSAAEAVAQLAVEPGKGSVTHADHLEVPACFMDKRHHPHPNILRPPKPAAPKQSEVL